MPRPTALLLAATVLAVTLLIDDGTPATATPTSVQVCATESTTVTSVGEITETACALKVRSVKVWLVDFKGAPAEAPGNYQVVRDQQGADRQHIDQYADDCGQTDAVEWKDCKPDKNPDGKREKDWPVAYVKNSQVTLKQVRFRVTLEEGGAAIKGAKVTGEVTWPARPGPGKFVCENVDQVGDELVINDPTCLTSTDKLPDFVTVFDNLEKMRIKWTVVEGGNTHDAGTTYHTVYVLYKAPLKPPDSTIDYTDKIYLTLVDYTTHGADGMNAEAQVVAGVWSEFPDREVRRRELDPKIGSIGHNGTQLTYWIPGKNASEQFGTCSNTTTEEMLRNINGQCGAWADFLTHSLAIHGIRATFSEIECDLLDCNQFLVKEWVFGGQNSDQVGAGWPYLKGDMDKTDEPTRPNPGGVADVVNRPGVPGQGNPEPPPNFGNHYVVRYGGQIYDPSYGTGPFPTLGDWDDKSLAGFCTLHLGHFDCRDNPAGAQTKITP